MGQITIYLDSETEIKLMKITKKQSISKSKWIAELIKEKPRTHGLNGLPASQGPGLICRQHRRLEKPWGGSSG